MPHLVYVQNRHIWSLSTNACLSQPIVQAPLDQRIGVSHRVQLTLDKAPLPNSKPIKTNDLIPQGKGMLCVTQFPQSWTATKAESPHFRQDMTQVVPIVPHAEVGQMGKFGKYYLHDWYARKRDTTARHSDGYIHVVSHHFVGCLLLMQLAADAFLRRASLKSAGPCRQRGPPLREPNR